MMRTKWKIILRYAIISDIHKFFDEYSKKLRKKKLHKMEKIKWKSIEVRECIFSQKYAERFDHA